MLLERAGMGVSLVYVDAGGTDDELYDEKFEYGKELEHRGGLRKQ